MKKTMKIKIKSLLIIILFSMSVIAKAQTWIVPEEHKAMVNPVEFNAASIIKGSDIYLKNCKSCHGEVGKNNGLKLQPPPPDMVTEKMQDNTNGELFYKISEGKGTMPQLKNVLSVDDRWLVINYIRSFNPNYKPEALAETADAFAGNGLVISLSVDTSTKKVTAFVTGNENGQKTPVANSDLVFTVKRYFGAQEIGTAKTNVSGYAEMTIPTGLAGDTFGFLTIVVKFKNEKLYGNVNAIIKAQLGAPTIPVDVFAKRSLWSWNSQTSWWIILSYVGVVAGVWITILYVVSLIAKIPKQGKINQYK